MPNYLLMLLVILLSCLAVGADVGANPALEWLNPEIVFCLSFDDESLYPDLSLGDVEPLSSSGEPSFVDGLYGKALLLGGPNGIMVNYQAADNLELTKPGALSFWMTPEDWIQADGEAKERPYLRFLHLQGVGAGYLFIQRQGFVNKTLADGKLSKRSDMFQVGIYSFKDWQKQLLGAYDTIKWEKGEWRLFVVNWDRNGMSLSINGKLITQTKYSRPLSEEDFPEPGSPKCLFRIGSGKSKETTRLDELIVYRRALSEAEMLKLYQAGMAKEK